MTSRLIDIQRDKLEVLEALCSRLTKSAKDKRTKRFLEEVEEQRAAVWTQISANHEKLIEATPPPPEEYLQQYEKHHGINEKIKKKLQEFHLAAGSEYNETPLQEIEDADKTAVPTGGSYEGKSSISGTIPKNPDVQRLLLPNPVAANTSWADQVFQDEQNQNNQRAINTVQQFTPTANRNNQQFAPNQSLMQFTPSAQATEFGFPSNQQQYNGEQEQVNGNQSQQYQRDNTSAAPQQTYQQNGSRAASNGYQAGNYQNEYIPYANGFQANNFQQNGSRPSASGFQANNFQPNGSRSSANGFQANNSQQNESRPSTNGYHATSSQQLSNQHYLAPQLQSYTTPDDDLSERINRIPMQASRNMAQRQYQPQYRSENFFYDIKKKIPPFDGTDYLSWTDFKSLILDCAEKAGYDQRQAFHLLKDHLRGKALLEIKGTIECGNSFQKAMNKLNNKYNNERKHVQHNIDMVHQAGKTLTKYRDAESYQQMLSKLGIAVFNINQLGTSAETIICHTAVAQLDDKTRSRLEDYVGGRSQALTYDVVEAFLEKEINVCEQQYHKHKEEYKEYKDKSSHKPRNDNKKGASQALTAQDTKEAKELKCFKCKAPHSVMECPEFIASKDRIAFMKRIKCCIYCGLHKWQLNSPCKSKSKLKCDICEDQHATALHTEASGGLLCTNEETVRITPTAIVQAEAKDGTKQKIRLVIDTGAQSSFISTDTVNSLGLKIHKMKSIAIKGINNTSQSICDKYALVTLQARNGNQKIIVKAYVMKTVAAPMPNEKVNVGKIDKRFKLADEMFNERSSISMLLGTDTFSEIFMDKTQIRIINDLVYMPTAFGYVVMGAKEKTNDENRKENNDTVLITQSITKPEFQRIQKKKNNKIRMKKMLRFYGKKLLAEQTTKVQIEETKNDENTTSEPETKDEEDIIMTSCKPNRFYLKRTSKGIANRIIDLSKQSTSIGRAKTNSVKITQLKARISQHHCEIINNSGQIILKDFSTNGCFVNGIQVKHKEIELKPSDIVGFASNEEEEDDYKYIVEQMEVVEIIDDPDTT